jgi:Right handed beta helix region
MITPTRHRQLLAALLVGAVLVIAPSASAGVSPGSATCHRVAAPTGSDRASGGPFRPFRTVQRLVDSLRPGQIGCLLQGVYSGSVRIGRGGRPGAPVVLASYPGQTATIVGRLQIVKGANYVTVTGLVLDGKNSTRLPSPTIDSDHDTFSYDDVTDDHTGICFEMGSPAWGWATDTLITHDLVHGCGQHFAGDNYQHGLYLVAATDTTVEWSMIYGNAARGIQLYPDAQHTTIDHNIISGNGEGILIGGDGGSASSYTNVYDNIISDATARHDVESWWPPGNPIGIDNRVHNNCVWGGREGAIDTAAGGIVATHNLKVNPGYADASADDYALSTTSPCLALVGNVQAAVDGTAGAGSPASGTLPGLPTLKVPGLPTLSTSLPLQR